MVFVGKVTKFRGNKGEVVVETSPEIRWKGNENGLNALIKTPKHQFSRKIESVAEINGQTIMKFYEVDTIADAMMLVGARLYLSEPLDGPAEETLNGSVTGFSVFDTDGECWGEVTVMETEKINPLLVVRSDCGTLRTVPFQPAIVIQIDRRQKRILIDPPAGLKELNT